METFGAKTSGDLAFGATEGFPYSVQLIERGEPPQLLFQFVLNGNTRKLAAGLKKKQLPFTRWFAGPAKGGHLLAAVLTPPSEFYLKASITDLLAAATTAGAAAGLAPPQSCPLCHLPGCDAYAFLDEGYRPTHTACLGTRLALPQQDTRTKKTVRGHVLTGILGALLGAFIGALPIWAMALSKSTLYWALYVFIPILSGLCYRLCRGKANLNVAGLSVLLSSLLLAFALEQVWYWLLLSARYGINIPFSISISQYLKTHTLLITLREMLMCLVALLVGFVATTVFLRRYAAEGQVPPRILRGAGFIRATAMPIKAATQQADKEAGESPAPPAPE